MSSNSTESPYKPLWKGNTKSGKEKYYGAFTCPCCFNDAWINLFPNTSKRSEKAPDFHFSVNKKEEKT